MENPIKMDDLGVPLFLETPIFGIRWRIEKLMFYFLRWDTPPFRDYFFELVFQPLKSPESKYT